MKKNSKLLKVDELLSGLIKNRKWEKNFAVGRLQQDWATVVGDSIAAHTKPMYIKGRKLFIEVDSPIWSNQLNFLQDQVIEKVNGYYKQEITIKEIYFRVKIGQ